MRDAIVVGAGIIGATVCAALKARGLDAACYDDGRPNAGTPPSGGHLKPSWFGGLPREQYAPALDLLDELWGVKNEMFRIRPSGGLEEIGRVDTDKVTAYPRLGRVVTGVRELAGYPLVNSSYDMVRAEERCRLLVVCTGAWAAELLPQLKMKTKQGVSFRVTGIPLPEPFVEPWAPYKQVVAHEQDDGEVWVGDGTAVYPENWTESRTDKCMNRCLEALGPPPGPVNVYERTGWRPYCDSENKGDPCLLRRLGPRAWVATGAGKMGTIASAWAALRILENLPS
jgi:glycine/D-amino acid oxidase-like deaminating enzyme